MVVFRSKSYIYFLKEGLNTVVEIIAKMQKFISCDYFSWISSPYCPWHNRPERVRLSSGLPRYSASTGGNIHSTADFLAQFINIFLDLQTVKLADKILKDAWACVFLLFCKPHFPASKNLICRILKMSSFGSWQKRWGLKVWKIERRTGQGLRAYGHTMAEATILHIFHDIFHHISNKKK